MMDKFADIKRIWRERFSDSRQWMTEVFPRIYKDDEAMTLVADGKIVSEMLLRQLKMKYRDAVVPIGYVYGAATAKSEQSKGYMSRLVEDSLREAYRRGDVMVSLLPARKRLYGFYARFGFSTIFFVDVQRFTAIHKFEYPEYRYIVEDTVTDADELAAAYTRLASQRPSTVLHDAEDFKSILIDNELDGGVVAVARDSENHEIKAIAFASSTKNNIDVRELVAEDDEAANAVMSSISKRFPGLMTIVEAYPERKNIHYAARGMGRIVNVEKFLSVLAEIDPRIDQRIVVCDPIISENCGCFEVKAGKVRKLAGIPEKVDLDINIEVLTTILFSEPSIGEIFNLHTCRPYISLVMS